MTKIEIVGWVVVGIYIVLMVAMMILSVFYSGQWEPECKTNLDCEDYCLSKCDNTKYKLEKTYAMCETTLFQGDRCYCGRCHYETQTEVRP